MLKPKHHLDELLVMLFYFNFFALHVKFFIFLILRWRAKRIDMVLSPPKCLICHQQTNHRCFQCYCLIVPNWKMVSITMKNYFDIGLTCLVFSFEWTQNVVVFYLKYFNVNCGSQGSTVKIAFNNLHCHGRTLSENKVWQFLVIIVLSSS